MPAFEIDTNAPAEKITPELVKELTELLAEMLALDVKVRADVPTIRAENGYILIIIADCADQN